jgi:uncharacterized protein YndB with AHSA1/START domain
MGVNLHDDGRRSVSVEVDVPGAQDTVWNTVATGAGISKWFMPTEVEARVGGTIVCKFGPDAESRATITDWEPPRRLVATSADLGPDAPAIESEWRVASLDDNTCRVRVTHAITTESDQWDKFLTDAEGGWPKFFEALRSCLAGDADGS